MEISPKWYAAINVRRSRRNYVKGKPIETEARKRLHDVCSGFKPFSGVRVAFIDEPPADAERSKRRTEQVRGHQEEEPEIVLGD